MRVAVVTTQFPFGPKESFLEAEVRSLAALVDDVTVFAIRPASAERSAAVDARALGPASAPTVALAARTVARSPAASARALGATLTAGGPLDARVKNAAVAHQGLALAELVRRRGIDHIHAHWLTTSSTVAMIASAASGVPWSATGHRFDVFAGNALARKARSARFIRLISDRSRDALARRVPEADRSKLRVVHLGVDLPAAAAPQPRAGALRVLCAANLVPVKGHDALIAAMAAAVERGVDVTCDLAGEGPERERIGAAIARRGLAERVALLGHVPHERLLASLRAGDYDAVALASTERGTEFEGIPVFLMEAMAAGVPCVATRTGAIPELVADGCGILVDQGDPQALAGALERLWRDPSLRGSLAEAARARVAAEFDTRRTTAQLADLMAASAPPERVRKS